MNLIYSRDNTGGLLHLLDRKDVFDQLVELTTRILNMPHSNSTRPAILLQTVITGCTTLLALCLSTSVNPSLKMRDG